MDYIYDIETYKNLFSVVVLSQDGKEGHIFEVSPRKDNSDELRSFLRKLSNGNNRMVGFNNIAFDYPILHYFINDSSVGYKKVYDKAQELFTMMSQEERFSSAIKTKDELIEQVDLYKINHFDNKAKSTSLKILEFNMRMDSIQDLPYSPHEPLEGKQFDEVIRYNVNDVVATLKFYQENLGSLELRKNLSSKYGINFTNMSDSKIGSEIFIQELETAKPQSCFKFKDGKRVINQTKRNVIFLKNVILPYVKFERPEFQAVLNWFKDQAITETNGVFSNILESDLGEVAKYARMVKKKSKKMDSAPTEEQITDFRKDIPFAQVEEFELKSGKNKKSYYFTWNIAESLNVVVNGHEYVFGVGGIHSSIDAQAIFSDDEYVIADWDVASYYPNLAIKNLIYPKHLSTQFCTTYEKIYEERKLYPKSSPENLALKLALNGTYGNSNNKYSPFYDPQYTMTITVNGQLSLCMLIEQILKLEGSSSVQSNTDGITMRIKRQYSEAIDKLVKDWENITKLEMERNNYSAMFIRDVNSYLCKYEGSSKAKAKGAYEVTSEHHKDQSSLVIQKAVNAYLTNGTPIEEFIKNHKDKYDFMLRTKVPKSFKLVLVDNDGIEHRQQNVSRFYVSASDKAGSLIKVMPPLEGKEEDRRNGVCAGRKVKMCNNILDFDWDIDYTYYVDDAVKLISIFERKE